MARARAGAEPPRSASAAPQHTRHRHTLALRRAHQHQEGPVRRRHTIPGREVRLAVAATCYTSAGGAGTRGGAARATVHRAAERPEALASFQQLKSECEHIGATDWNECVGAVYHSVVS